MNKPAVRFSFPLIIQSDCLARGREPERRDFRSRFFPEAGRRRYVAARSTLPMFLRVLSSRYVPRHPWSSHPRLWYVSAVCDVLCPDVYYLQSTVRLPMGARYDFVTNSLVYHIISPCILLLLFEF